MQNKRYIHTIPYIHKIPENNLVYSKDNKIHTEYRKHK